MQIDLCFWTFVQYQFIVSCMNVVEYKPEIVSPAGDMESALAGIYAGADAIFLALHQFSAPRISENITLADIAKLTHLAHNRGVRVYIACDTFIKPNDVISLGRYMTRLVSDVNPDALIMQDIGIIAIAKQLGFTGEIHLSTLANITTIDAIHTAQGLGVDRIALPRWIHLEELKSINTLCPQGVDLELCVYGVWDCVDSCHWLTSLRKKGSARRHCMQSCGRLYARKKKRLRSGIDYSLESLIYDVLPLHRVRSWKLEERKNNAYYVYHATKAYIMLRDYAHNPEAMKEAYALLQCAMSREMTSSILLEDKKRIPVERSTYTNAAIAIGNIVMKGKDFVLEVHKNVYKGDVIRIGYEDDIWCTTLRIQKSYTMGATLPVRFASKKRPQKVITAFLVKRKAVLPMEALRALRKELQRIPYHVGKQSHGVPCFAHSARFAFHGVQYLQNTIPQGKANKKRGLALWLSPRSVNGVSRTIASRITWWLPPVVWHDDEKQFRALIAQACKNGAKHFVCNEFMQYSVLPENVVKTLGPFCHASNIATLHLAKECGYTKAIVSTELNKEDICILAKESPLSLGVVTKGYIPIGITRFVPEGFSLHKGYRPPLQEKYWVKKYGSSYWLYPTKGVDMSSLEDELVEMGFSFFVHITEYLPKSVAMMSNRKIYN